MRIAVLGAPPVTYAKIGAILAEAGWEEMVPGPPGLVPVTVARQADLIIYDMARAGELSPSQPGIASLAAELPTLALSAEPSPAEAASAISAGAVGYLSWLEPDTVAAAAALSAGLAPPIPAADGTARALRSAADRFKSVEERLTQREREVLIYVTRGFTHQQTATRMRVSKTTVDTYVARIRAKLQVGNKAELALAGITMISGLSQTPDCGCLPG
jgi:DNA-binding NarL/FixJ family response regulator